MKINNQETFPAGRARTYVELGTLDQAVSRIQPSLFRAFSVHRKGFLELLPPLCACMPNPTVHRTPRDSAAQSR